VIELRAGDLAVDVVPEIGGSIAAFRLGGVDVMRALSDADLAAGNVLGTASFPMVPYANRIAGNAFEFRGRQYTFTMNNPPEIYNVHGTGWRRPWTVTRSTGTDAELSLEVIEPGEAYSYRATQHYALDAEGLSIAMTVANAGGETMPFGFGHHPWFQREPGVTVQFSARTFHLTEPEVVIGERITLPPELAFETPRELPARWRCSDYGGWHRSATVRFPGRGLGLRLTADAPFGHLMFYADPELPVFCIEPQTNASCAFNRAGGFDDPEDGVIILEPGASAGGSLRFVPFPLAGTGPVRSGAGSR
jgi:aldose 1-epimerase